MVCARMLNSVLDGLSKHGKEGEAARDLVLMILKRMVVEMKLLAVYHKSLLFKHHGAEIKYDYKTCYRDGLHNVEDEMSSDENVIRDKVHNCSIDTAHEMENGEAGLTVIASPFENSSVAHGSDGQQTHRSRVCDSPSEVTARPLSTLLLSYCSLNCCFPLPRSYSSSCNNIAHVAYEAKREGMKQSP